TAEPARVTELQGAARGAGGAARPGCLGGAAEHDAVPPPACGRPGRDRIELAQHARELVELLRLSASREHGLSRFIIDLEVPAHPARGGWAPKGGGYT